MKNHWSEVESGVRIAGAWLCVITWLMLVAAGIGIAFQNGPHPRVVALACLVTAALAAVMTVDRWVKILPAVLGLSVLNSFLTVVSGHAGVSSKISVPRGESAFVLLILAACGALAVTFPGRKLTGFDRGALLGFLGCQALTIATFPLLLGPLLMLCCLFAAWAVGRRRSMAKLN